jgi:hypothetical protein
MMTITVITAAQLAGTTDLRTLGPAFLFPAKNERCGTAV